MTDTLLSVPIGTIIDFAGPNNPTGYLNCDGATVSRTTYAALFAAIGTTWGSGDGSTTFNLPDLRGRTSIGAGVGSGLTSRTLGTQNIGEESHKLTSSESGNPKLTHSSITQPAFQMPDHKHKVNGIGMWVSASGNGNGFTATATWNWVANSGGQFEKYGPGYWTSDNPTSKPGCTRTTNVAVGDHGAADASSAHNNMQPSAVVRKLIRAK